MTKISRLLAVCLLHSAAFAIDYDQKTFLLPHNPVHTNNLEQTLFRTHRHNAALDQKGHVQITGLYGSSTNRAALGKYFGVGNGKNSFKVGREVVDPLAVPLVPDKSVDLDGGYLVHDRAHRIDSQLGGKVTLLPKQTLAGVNLTYRQAFAGAFDGAFFQVSAPIVQVRNDLGLKIEDATSARGIGGKDFSLADFFAGNVNVADNNENSQTALTKGKMVAGSRTASGVADLSVQLGYQLVANESNHVDLYLRGIVPTGNKSSGEYVFEPLVGNNGHFGMGLGLDGDVTLWADHERGRVHLNAGAAYNYIFESTEVRADAITRRTEDAFKYNSYALVGKAGDTSLAPAANALAQDFRVRPGSQLEFNTGLSFHSTGGVSVNIGYNMNWRETERVYRKTTADFLSDTNYVVAAKAATMNARVPAFIAADRVPAALITSNRAGILYDATIARIAAGAFDGSAAQAAISAVKGDANAAVVPILNPALTGIGTDAAARGGAAAVNTASHGAGAADQPIQLAAYQAAAQLYAATNEDILGAGAAVAVAPGQGRANALVPVAATARNLIQNVNNARTAQDFAATRQEALVTHVLGASLGYSFEVQRGFPIMLGVGGQYDLPHSTNAGLEGYKLFAKLGISF